MRPGKAAAVLAVMVCPLQLTAATQWNELPLSQNTFHHFPDRYVTHTIDIPLKKEGGELEYKVSMKKGDVVTYTWQVKGVSVSDEFYAEFHGHTPPPPGKPGDLMFYRKANGLSESGALVAPFDGIHGWYLQNDSAQDAVVRLSVSGFFEVIPDQIKK